MYIEINSATILLKTVDLFVIMLAVCGRPLSGYIDRNLSICHYTTHNVSSIVVDVNSIVADA